MDLSAVVDNLQTLAKNESQSRDVRPQTNAKPWLKRKNRNGQ